MPKFEQIALKAFIARTLPLISHNRRAPGLRYRPDFVFQRNDNLVIVECDENQHASYCPRRERIREARILAAYHREYGVQPKLIRYDPAPDGVRACARAALVADIISRELHDVGHTPTAERVCIFEDNKITCY